MDLLLDCTLNQTCLIQQFQDRDCGTTANDSTCGQLRYYGHQGTDFAVPTVRAVDTPGGLFGAGLSTKSPHV